MANYKPPGAILELIGNQLKKLDSDTQRQQFLALLEGELIEGINRATLETHNLITEEQKRMEEKIFDAVRVEIEELMGKIPLPPHDPGLREYWLTRRRRFTDWLQAARWTPECGSELGVFERKQPGHRCLWSCHWETDAGIVRPSDLLIVAEMTDNQVIAEVEDVVAWGKRSGVPTRDFECDEYGAKVLSHIRDGEDEWIEEAKRFIERRRPNYPPYIAPWAKPTGRIWADFWRPGWGKPEDYGR